MTTLDQHQQRAPSAISNTAIPEEDEGDDLSHDGYININPIQDNKQIDLLRQLLLVERQRNEQRRENNEALKKYLSRLQIDYLRSQKDLVETLELANKIKNQKQAQIDSVEITLAEKQRTIEQLQSSMDESKLREEFEELLKKQKKVAELEADQLRGQIQALEKQIVGERVANSETLQQFQNKLDDGANDYENKSAKLTNKINQLQNNLEELLNTPANLMIKSLKEENSQLNEQLDDLNLVIDRSHTRYDNLRKSLENLLVEQEQLEQKNLDAIVKMQEQQSDQRIYLSELKMALEDKEEVIQILQFNLQRSEKRVKNLLGAIKGKESTYREMLEQLQAQHSEELDQKACQIRLLEKKLVDLEVDSDKKQNDIVKLELQHENQLESIRTDRDERIVKLQEELHKYEMALQESQVNLVKEIEGNKSESKQVKQNHKEAQEFREENQKLIIEVSKWKAKIESKQEELESLTRKYQNHCQESDSDRLRAELEGAKKKLSKTEEILNDLRKDNSKLHLKVKLHEANMSKVGEAIKREHAKMIRDYEQRLKQIRADQSACDQNKIRYRRYGYKLKKYYEHLRMTHQHICNPTMCRVESTQCNKIADDEDNTSSTTTTATKLEQLQMI